MTWRPIVYVVVCSIGLHPLAAGAQDTVGRTERRKFTSPSQTVSDDPRRVPEPAGVNASPGTLVLRGGRIFDGTGAPVREGTVVIVRNHIDRILPASATNWPSDARVIDVTGKTVMPGLIDLHTHLTYPDDDTPGAVAGSRADAALRGVERLRYYIESGITSIRDVGSEGDVPFRLQAWVKQNRVIGPRVFAAGQLITSKGGHGDDGGPYNSTAAGMVRVASGPDDWREAVREQFTNGADVIKIASHFSPAEVSAAISEAHALGLKVTCDCETFYITWAVEAGIDMIEHPLPRSDETIALMKQHGTESDPTLTPYMIIFNSAGAYYGTTSRRFFFSKPANFELVKKMKDAGITLGIGTDLVRDWFRYLPAPYINEMQQFVRLGYTVPEVLQIATRTNAQMLDMGDRLGTLETGKLADITVIDGRPDVTLDDIAKVWLVVRDGWVVVDQGHISVPRHVPTAMPPDR